MPPRPPILDLKRLRADLSRQRAARPPGIGPGGRSVTGSMAVVRENLEELRALHDAGHTWVDIAAGLASQGVTQSSGQPLTGKRLTALIASVEREAIAKSRRQATRAARIDLAAATPTRADAVRRDLRPAPPKPSRLSPELDVEAGSAPHLDGDALDDARRRQALQDYQKLKKDR